MDSLGSRTGSKGKGKGHKLTRIRVGACQLAPQHENTVPAHRYFSSDQARALKPSLKIDVAEEYMMR